jgi:hypothetical protein
MAAGAFTASSKLAYSDTWLAAGVGAMDYLTLRPQAPIFKPQAIMCNSSSNATEQTAGYAMVRGILYGENDDMVADYRIQIGHPIGLAFRKIWAGANTTARGIKLLCEQ